MKKKIGLLFLCAMLCFSFAFAPVSAMAASNAKILIVKVDGARVRTGQDLQHIVTSLKKGTRVVYMGKHIGSMYLVRTASGERGYVYKRYLGAYGAAPSKKVYSVTTRTGMFKRASSNSTRLRRLSKGTTVIVYSTSGSWAYIRTLEGKAGYVKRSCLKRAS